MCGCLRQVRVGRFDFCGGLGVLNATWHASDRPLGEQTGCMCSVEAIYDARFRMD